MYLNRNLIFPIVFCLLAGGCSSGFLGLAPAGDRKEYVYARNLYDQGEYQQAIIQLTQYIYKTKNVKRREARAYRLLGSSYEQLGQISKALEVYLEALEFHPRNIPLLLAAASLYRRTGLTGRSMDLYEKVLALEPNNSEALAGQAANYAALGFYSKSRFFYNRFFELNPNAAARYRARYANTFLQQRNFTDAFINITVALSQEPENADFWLLSAKARRGLGRPDEALADLDVALLFAPGRTDLLENKALWQYEAKKYQESLHTVSLIVAAKPQDPLALFIQAMNWYRLGKKKAARAQLEKISGLTPFSFIGKVARKALDEFPA